MTTASSDGFKILAILGAAMTLPIGMHFLDVLTATAIFTVLGYVILKLKLLSERHLLTSLISGLFMALMTTPEMSTAFWDNLQVLAML